MTFHCCALALIVLILFVGEWRAAASPAGARDPGYLSDALADRIVSVEQGWGELGLNVCAHEPGRPALALRIMDQDYAHGLGHHANGEIVLDLGGQFKTFEAEIGVQWQEGQSAGSVIFQIYVDDCKVFDSGVMRQSDRPKPVTVSVEGADELRLVALDAGDGIICDCANWAEARLARDPNAQTRPPDAGLDMAPFARVLAWDPKVMTGTRASRVEEFPAEDIAPYEEVPPDAEGGYPVPTYDGVGCIGLYWYENRLLRKVALRFPNAIEPPPVESIQLQYWIGESAWQGEWRPADIKPERVGNTVAWSVSFGGGMARGTQKVRWLFSDTARPIVLAGMSAFTRSRTNSVDIRIESTCSDAVRTAEIDMYNGVLLDPAQGSPYHCFWDCTKPLTLRAISTRPQRYKADRTVLRFGFPDTAFGVAVEDLQANDCVYVPHAGLFITRDPAPVTLDDYLKKIAGRKTVLDDVRERPDQDFPQAWAAVHNPIQDNGPMMLSLACDNRKFEVHRDGTVLFAEYTSPDEPRWVTSYERGPWRLSPHLGPGDELPITRRLEGGWLPMPVTSASEGDVNYRQRTYVAPIGDAPTDAPAWLRDRAVCVVELDVEDGGSEPAEVCIAVDLICRDQKRPMLRDVPEGMLVTTGNRVLALIDSRQAAPLTVESDGNKVILSGELAAGAGAQCFVYLPAWNVAPEEYAALVAGDGWARSFDDYWRGLLNPAMQIDVPDPLLTNIIRASQVHCLLAARCEDRGARVAPWISADRYGPLESEANAVIRGMDMNGQTDYARRSLEYLLARCNDAGFITTGYTVVGTGEVLWTLAEHYGRVRDRDWLRGIAPDVVRICRWVIRQREKTKRIDMHGEKVPEYGLMPPGVTADWNRYAYRFYNDSQYCLGLESSAQALSDIGDPASSDILREAERYRGDILRAFHWTQARTPVVRLEDGTWVPGDPALLDCFGRVDDFLPAEDGNRTWAYSVDVGAHHLAANRVLDPASRDVDWMAGYLEDVQFLRSGMGDYPEEENRRDVFSRGGFGKLQPYYGRMVEVYALRDDVKPFIRSFLNMIPSLASIETLSFWEHFHNIGGWNKTHETGWFLCQARLMFAMERGDELWLAPFVPNNWMEDGMKVAVANAPTRFGVTSYTIASAVAEGHIDATIELPRSTSARKVVLRLRHPDGKPMRSVSVQGKPHTDFDPQRETIHIDPTGETVTVRAEY